MPKEGEGMIDENTINLDEVIICLKRSDKGPMLYMKPLSRREMVNALGELQIALTREIIRYDDAAKRELAKKNSSGIINAARNRLFK